MTKEQVVFWLLLLRFNPDNNVLPNEVIDIAIGAIVAEPERKMGKWITVDKGLIVTSYKCSECGRTVRDDTGYDVAKDYPYCHCGAKMEGMKNE